MTDRVVAMSEDATHAHYLWASGFLVSFNKHTQAWTKQRIPHPGNIAEPTLNRELAPDVGGDDD